MVPLTHNDTAGNMTGVPRPADLANGYTCKYDAWNRLVEVKEGETVVASHEYDGLNRRTIEAFLQQSVTTYYLHKFYNASWQMLELRVTPTANAQPESLSVFGQYIWSARYIDALVLREYAGSLHYFLGDANFNVTTLVNTSGDARERYQYDPYGNVTVLNGAASDTDGAEWTADPNNSSDVDNHTLYTGRRLDHRTGLYDYRNRPYHAQLGRFPSRDPIGYDGGDVNLYRHVGYRPTNAIDPLGLQQLSDYHWVGAGYGFRPKSRCGGVKASLGCMPSYLRILVDELVDAYTHEPTLPKVRPSQTPNVSYNFGGSPSDHWIDKRRREQPIPGVKIVPYGQNAGGPTGGNHKTYPWPSAPGTLVGGGGSEPCIIVVIRCRSAISVFHFSPCDNPLATLSLYDWSKRGCQAIICGGNESNQSERLAADVISSVNQIGVPIVGISSGSGCGVQADGSWYETFDQTHPKVR